ncbi:MULTISPECIES: DUF2637 domain-containing protein [Nocardiopsis]|uniref:hypothetical protein n=1 Tax=Nocardiopsis TaxID=2013 RepID=UPI002657354D|nr:MULTISPECIES: hypothetical protein [Nocardiopsis]
MYELAPRHGEAEWRAALLPLSVDGMVVGASMTLPNDVRHGRKGGLLALDAAERRHRRVFGGQRRGGRPHGVVADRPRLAFVRLDRCPRTAHARVPHGGQKRTHCVHNR